MLSARTIRAVARKALSLNVARAVPRAAGMVSLTTMSRPLGVKRTPGSPFRQGWLLDDSVKSVTNNCQIAPLTRSYASAKAAPTEVSSILESKIRGVSEEANLDETGRVLSVG